MVSHCRTAAHTRTHGANNATAEQTPAREQLPPRGGEGGKGRHCSRALCQLCDGRTAPGTHSGANPHSTHTQHTHTAPRRGRGSAQSDENGRTTHLLQPSSSAGVPPASEAARDRASAATGDGWSPKKSKMESTTPAVGSTASSSASDSSACGGCSRAMAAGGTRASVSGVGLLAA